MLEGKLTTYEEKEKKRNILHAIFKFTGSHTFHTLQKELTASLKGNSHQNENNRRGMKIIIKYQKSAPSKRRIVRRKEQPMVE